MNFLVNLFLPFALTPTKEQPQDGDPSCGIKTKK